VKKAQRQSASKKGRDNMQQDRDLGTQDRPLVCSLTASERAGRSIEIDHLFAGVQQMQELDDGYAFRFAGQDPWPQNVFSFIEGERSCCLFFTFELIFLPGQGPLWLHIRGPEGVKEIIQTMASSQRSTPTPD
jgi:hypothetical protein